jgi:hypothetical protein
MSRLVMAMFVVGLLVGCWPEQNQLSEESQRDQQFFRCRLDAMQRHQPEDDYTFVCMRAAGWRNESQNESCKESYMYSFCWVRMR